MKEELFFKKVLREDDPGRGECGPAGVVRWMEKDYPGGGEWCITGAGKGEDCHGDRRMLHHRGSPGEKDGTGG